MKKHSGKASICTLCTSYAYLIHADQTQCCYNKPEPSLEANIERAALTCGPNRAICEAADCLRSMTEEPHHQLELLGLR